MKKILSALFGAVAAIVVTLGYEYFSTSLSWPYFASLLAAANLGAIFLVIYEFFDKSSFIKRKFSPISKIEGEWEITIRDWGNRPSSIAVIKLSGSEYIYKGYGVSEDGKLASEWASRDIHYDEEKEELSFTADALVVDSGKRFRNYGYIKFHKNASGKYDHGAGYFVDMGDDVRQAYMTVARIKPERFDELIDEIHDVAVRDSESTEKLHVV